MTARIASAALGAALWMGSAATARAEPASGYTVTIDRSAEEVEVVPIEGASPDRAAVVINDLYLDPTCLIVGQPGRYPFTFEGDGGMGPTRGYLARPGQPRRLVWVRIWEHEERGGRIVVENTLHALNRSQLRDLRGVFIESWSDQVAADLARLDPTRVCISSSTFRTIPRFPAGIRYLAVSPVYECDFSGLKGFPQLAFLSVNADQAPFDAASIATLSHLQYLRVAVGELQNAGRLEALRSIRRLRLVAKKGIERVGFLRAMPRIETLTLHGPVDLTPIEKLTGLIELDASASPASRLPAVRLPALRKASLMSTKIPDAEVERFRALNPDAVVLHRWTPLLRARLAGATEVKLELLAIVRGDPTRSTVVRGAPEIAKLIAALEIDDPDDFVEGCMPTHRLTFRRTDGPPAGESVYLADGNSVRWDGFPGDAPLTARGLRETRAWMASHGMKWGDCGGERKTR